MADTCAAVILILVTLLLPPAGVFFISGCSADLLINIFLTILGYFPGHIHAFYTLWVYYEAKSRGREGRMRARSPPGIFSKRILNGGERPVYYYPEQHAPSTQGYGTNAPVPPAGGNGGYQPVR
ncbi:hypothetical protein McanMca71_000908 [Microsporum canis]|uniref:Stress response RCI peptide n=1 Tax=Arthroderma otae (strain ATCC MYA-4605 / CBS 113480) TaxID=554155 RepID=C5FI60_ARTOC|nr:uncharacterized protein MCYG_01859 [Microsporum canis CBS 113480]EEQ29040.1 predicted protein [Microsporum canis CBS 113480]